MTAVVVMMATARVVPRPTSARRGDRRTVIDGIVLQGFQRLLFGNPSILLGLKGRLALAISVLGLVEDAEEVFALGEGGQSAWSGSGRTRIPTVLTTLPDLSITAMVSPNGGMMTGWQ